MVQILTPGPPRPPNRSVLPDALSVAVPEPVTADPGSRPSRRDGSFNELPEAVIKRPGKEPMRYLPQVVVATLLVAVLPVAAVWVLRYTGIVGSPWLCLGLAIGLSTLVSWAGCAYWQRSKGSGDLLFSELLVWGWLQRLRAQRQLEHAVQLLGALATAEDEPPVGRSVDEQQHLLRQLAAALEAEDRYTRGHSDRVARYATRIACTLGLAKHDVETVRAAALVHDVGKLLIAPELLDKRTRLTDAEFEVIKRHPVDGAEMVVGLRNDELTAIVRHHHERLDGKGYPGGLAGEQIPLGARIIAVADTFDAITSVRPYRPRRDHRTALDILTREQGRQLDHDVVRAFLTCYSGRRSVAVWAALASLLQRGVSWLTGEAGAATVTSGNVLATAVATVAIGGAAMVSPVAVRAAPDRDAAAHTSPRSPAPTVAARPNRAAAGVRGSSFRPVHAGVNGSRRGSVPPSAGLAGHPGRRSPRAARNGTRHDRSATVPSATKVHPRNPGAAQRGTPTRGVGTPAAPGSVTGSAPVASGGAPSVAGPRGGSGPGLTAKPPHPVKAKPPHPSPGSHKPLPSQAQAPPKVHKTPPGQAKVHKTPPGQANQPPPGQANQPPPGQAGTPPPGQAGTPPPGHVHPPHPAQATPPPPVPAPAQSPPGNPGSGKGNGKANGQ